MLPRQFGTRVGQTALMFCFRIYLAILRISGRCYCDLTALDALRGQGGLVIAPNHPSLIDVLLKTSRLPHITCIMKAELWGNIFLGGSARLARFIGNDAPRSMVKQAVAELGRGSQLLIFPEGTRTVEQPVNPFKGGFALIAKQAAVPVQTDPAII
jgi:1-acyl-sn-glycerol-3-phosphate acyltransferase